MAKNSSLRISYLTVFFIMSSCLTSNAPLSYQIFHKNKQLSEYLISIYDRAAKKSSASGRWVTEVQISELEFFAGCLLLLPSTVWCLNNTLTFPSCSSHVLHISHARTHTHTDVIGAEWFGVLDGALTLGGLCCIRARATFCLLTMFMSFTASLPFT